MGKSEFQEDFERHQKRLKEIYRRAMGIYTKEELDELDEKIKKSEFLQDIIEHQKKLTKIYRRIAGLPEEEEEDEDEYY